MEISTMRNFDHLEIVDPRMSEEGEEVLGWSQRRSAVSYLASWGEEILTVITIDDQKVTIHAREEKN